MSALRVVLIAEGNGELRSNPLRGPGSPIHADEFGPGHVLFARAIESRRKVPRAAVHFIEPLRTTRATIAKGSSLLHKKTLRQLLNYFQPAHRPDLVIVLVDADGEASRKRDLEAMVSDMPGTKMIVVAIQEFEAWLVADAAALSAVLETPAARVPQHPESLARGEAKRLLKDLSAAVADQRESRLSLSERLDVEIVAKKCPAFATCLSELQSLAL